jgi:predicted outer membrane protein
VKRVIAALALGFFGALLLGSAPAQANPGDDPVNEPAPAGFVMPDQVDVQVFADYDKVFLDKVKQAGLWEIPSGDWAEQKGLSEQTRIVGKLIAADHRVLDDDVKRVAARFGYTLPTKPTADQQYWLDELKAAKGKEFDRLFAMRLHFAHGLVYQAIADVRAHSRNPLMRAFAKQCEIFVHRHMALLETTGEVSFDDLPKPVVPKGNLRASDNRKKPVTLIALFAVTGAIGIAGVARALRGAV